MTIQRLGDVGKAILPTQTQDDDNKPLVREYGKAHPDIYNECHLVLSGRISSSGKWCLLETENYILLVAVGNSSVQALYNDILPALNGKKGNALVVEPVKKDKYGGCIGVDDESECWYTFSETDLTFSTDVKQPNTKHTNQKKLSLEMFTCTKSVSDTGATIQHNSETSQSTTATKGRVRKPTT